MNKINLNNDINFNRDNNGGQTPESLIKITYSELKELRDNSQLVPGTQYRITDYHCTTTQENTNSADHQFDIIVTADSESILNENARAIQHEFNEPILDGYSSTYVEIMTYIENMEYSGKIYFLYESNSHDLQMLVRYDELPFPDIYLEREYPYEFYPAWTRGKDGDSWEDWESGRDYGESINFKIDPIPYFKDCNLAAWELKYSLDNDINKFAWADIGVWKKDGDSGPKKAIKVYESEEDIYIHIRYPNGDINGKFAWAYTNTSGDPTFDNILWSDIIFDDLGYTNTENIIPGETIFEYGGYSAPVIDYKKFGGTGVIYYMKDEWNNECPYDFKNIQFKRKLTNGKYNPNSGTNTWVYTFNATEDLIQIDATTINWSLIESDYVPKDVYGNKIGVIQLPMNIDDFFTCRFILNNNVFLCGVLGVQFQNCHSNILGDNCCDNTFNDNCFSNIFNNNCYSNIFGSYCSNNILGNYCCHNMFGDGHFIIDYCNYIILGDNVQYCDICGTSDTKPYAYLQNIKIAQGTQGINNNRLAIYIDTNLSYETYVGKNSSGTLVIKNLLED